MLDQKRLKECLSYNPVTGDFTWLICTYGYRSARKAGYVGSQGYILIGIDREKYSAHRLAWLYMTGKWPKQIDHRDLNRANNAWNNLREGGYPENNANKMVRADSMSGAKGVYRYHNRTRPWNAKIGVKGKQYNLGYFATKEEAAQAYATAAIKHYGEFASF